MRLLTLQAAFGWSFRVSFGIMKPRPSGSQTLATNRTFQGGGLGPYLNRSSRRGGTLVVSAAARLSDRSMISWHMIKVIARTKQTCNPFRGLYYSKCLREANGVSEVCTSLVPFFSGHPTHSTITLTEFQHLSAQVLLSADPSRRACHIRTIHASLWIRKPQLGVSV